MRLSVEKDDPGYRAYRSLPRNVAPRVTVDGHEVSDVVTVDDRRGYVLAYQRDHVGYFAINSRRREIALKQIRGKVAIELVRGHGGGSGG